MSNFVFVIDADKRPLDPIHPGQARLLLNQKKAAVWRRYPFTIILKESRPDAPVTPLELKTDPGSKTTGFALLMGSKLVWAAELTHRGNAIKDALQTRSVVRRGRRNRKTRYRQPRFLNRTRPEGWLAPSLQHRVDTTLTWVNRLRKVAPIDSLAMELVKFDLQKMENPEISGVEYQQGTLYGFEVKEYLLEKFNHQCAYCGAKDVVFEVEHVLAKSKSGTDRVSNLALACHDCNEKKGNQDIRDFLSGKPDVLKRVLAQIKTPLKDAAAVNATRWALFRALKETGLPVATGSGGKTKFNRKRLGLPKTHWLDAACVGNVDELQVLTTKPLLIKATGHGTRQMCRTDKFGFPSRYVPRFKFVKGFQTGDIVKAIVLKGKKTGTHVGRVAVRSTGSFNISTCAGLVQGVSHKYCTVIHSKDGYAYTF